MDRPTDEEQFCEWPGAPAGALIVSLALLAGVGALLWDRSLLGAAWVIVLLWPLLLGLPILLVPRRKGLRVGPDGLTELGHWWPDVVHAWSEIRGVTFGETGIQIGVRDGSVWVGRHCRGWRRLGRLIRERLSERLDDEPESVSPQQICRWLGIADDGVLVCTPGRIFALYGCPLSVLAIAAWVSVPLASAIGVVIGIVVAAAVWAWSYAQRTVIRADGFGCSVRHGFRRSLQFDWADVVDVAEAKGLASRFYWDYAGQAADHCVTVTTTEGQFYFHLSDARGAPLRDCLRELLAARERGERLPAGSAVTPASLSRPRLTGEEAAERGLSAVREERA